MPFLRAASAHAAGIVRHQLPGRCLQPMWVAPSSVTFCCALSVIPSDTITAAASLGCLAAETTPPIVPGFDVFVENAKRGGVTARASISYIIPYETDTTSAMVMRLMQLQSSPE